MPEYPAIENLVPHAKPMLLLNRVLEAAEEHIVCEVVVRNDGLFDTSGEVPALVGIEYMAQTVSAFSGLVALRAGMPVQLGFLLGTRSFDTNVARFTCGETLAVKAQRIMLGNDGMAVFQCSVEGGTVKQLARLSVFEPSDPQSFIQRSRG